MKKLFALLALILSACSASPTAPTSSTVSLQKIYFLSGGSDLCILARNASGALSYSKEKCIEYVGSMSKSTSYEDYTANGIPTDDVLFYDGAKTLCADFLPYDYTDEQCNAVVDEMKRKDRYAFYKRDLDIQMTKNPGPTFTHSP